MLKLGVYLLRIRHMKSAIKAPKTKQANIITSILNVRKNVPLIVFVAILITIKTNIKQPVTSNGLFHFRDAYRINVPIVNGIKHPIIISIAFHIRSPLFFSITEKRDPNKEAASHRHIWGLVPDRFPGITSPVIPRICYLMEWLQGTQQRILDSP